MDAAAGSRVPARDFAIGWIRAAIWIFERADVASFISLREDQIIDGGAQYEIAIVYGHLDAQSVRSPRLEPYMHKGAGDDSVPTALKYRDFWRHRAVLESSIEAAVLNAS